MEKQVTGADYVDEMANILREHQKTERQKAIESKLRCRDKEWRLMLRQIEKETGL